MINLTDSQQIILDKYLEEYSEACESISIFPDSFLDTIELYNAPEEISDLYDFLLSELEFSILQDIIMYFVEDGEDLYMEYESEIMDFYYNDPSSFIEYNYDASAFILNYDQCYTLVESLIEGCEITNFKIKDNFDDWFEFINSLNIQSSIKWITNSEQIYDE